MTAYRQQATDREILFCPRDNELLDQVDFGVDMCPRCEGFWIANSVLELSGHQWPAGPQAWWRNAVRCPACATTGVVNVMKARTSNDVIIDQCFSHGVWLDRGELSRVMRDPVVEGLAKLREHLAALEPSDAQLLERRERWHAEQEERARLAEIERKRIEAERVKRLAEAQKTDAQRAEDRRKANEDKLREAEQLAESRRATERAREERQAEWQRIQAQIRIEEDRAAIAEAERARKRETDVRERETARERAVDAEIEAARRRAADVARAEAMRLVEMERRADDKLSKERAHQRLLATRAELDQRVAYLEARVDSLRLELSTTEDKLAKARSELVVAVDALAAAKPE